MRELIYGSSVLRYGKQEHAMGIMVCVQGGKSLDKVWDLDSSLWYYERILFSV